MSAGARSLSSSFDSITRGEPLVVRARGQPLIELSDEETERRPLSLLMAVEPASASDDTTSPERKRAKTPSRDSRSPWWFCVTRTERGNEIICRHPSCSAAMHTTTTSNILRHFETHHKEMFKAINLTMLDGKDPKFIIEQLFDEARVHHQLRTVNRFMSTDSSGGNKLPRNMKILIWLISSGRPFDTVSDPMFREIFEEFGVVLPSPRDLLRHVEPIKEAVVHNISLQLARMPFFAVSSDGWTDARLRHFISNVYHAIDPDTWVLSKFVLDLVPWHGSTTVEAVAAMIKLKATKWFPSDHQVLVGMSTDGARNALGCAEELVGDDAVWCTSHQLQLTVHDVIKEDAPTLPCKTDIDQVHTWVVVLRNHSFLRERLQAESSKSLELILDVPTRWNSTLAMLQRFIDLWPAIKAMVIKGDLDLYLDKDSHISHEVVHRVKHYCHALKLFADLTDKCGEEGTPTLCYVVRWVASLKQKLSRTDPSESTIDTDMKKALLAALTERFSMLFDTASPPLRAAVMCPSTACLAKFGVSPEVIEDVWARTVIEAVDRGKDIIAFKAGREEELRKVCSPLPLFDPELIKTEVTSYRRYCELNASELCGPKEVNPLMWWASSGKEWFPHVVPAALSLLCIPASSTSNERVFSTAAFELSKYRQRLTAEHLEEVVFVRENCKTLTELKQIVAAVCK